MNKLKCLLLSILFVSPMIQAQERTTKTQKGAMFSKPFDGGFNIMSVKNIDGSDLSHTINQTHDAYQFRKTSSIR